MTVSGFEYCCRLRLEPPFSFSHAFVFVVWHGEMASLAGLVCKLKISVSRVMFE